MKREDAADISLKTEKLWLLKVMGPSVPELMNKRHDIASMVVNIKSLCT